MPYSSTLGGFDDEPLTTFLKDKTVLSFREHFFAVNEIPHIACVVTYQEAVVRPEVDQAIKKERKKSAPTTNELAKELAEDDRVVFSALRSWRSSESEKEGVPPYIVLTNRQFLAIVAKRPESLGALGHIDGIGKKKLEKWGTPILAILKDNSVAVGVEGAEA